MIVHRRATSALLAMFVVFGGVSPGVTAPVEGPAPAAGLPASASPEVLGFSAERLKRLDDGMAKVVADGEVAGMVTLLARHGNVVALNTYGEAAPGSPMRSDTLFRIFSMTKPVTGVAMMILFEEGRWRLDDPVTKYVPEFKDLKVFEGLDASGKPKVVNAKRPPTMRELMSHTAGLGYGLSDTSYVDQQFIQQHVLDAPNRREMINRMAGIPLLFQPGEGWSYSAATDVQGYIVEKLSGLSLGDFMRRRIFDPLRMPNTFFTVPADEANRLGAVYGYDQRAGKLQVTTELFGAPLQDFTKPPAMEEGGGGLVSSVGDYARFAQMIANGGQLDGVRILSPATIELMDTNMIPTAVLKDVGGRRGLASRFNESVGFGLGFRVVNDPRGAGSLEGKGTMSWEGLAGTWFWIDPTNDVVFVGLIQRFGGPRDAVDLREVSRTLVYQALVAPAM